MLKAVIDQNPKKWMNEYLHMPYFSQWNKMRHVTYLWFKGITSFCKLAFFSSRHFLNHRDKLFRLDIRKIEEILSHCTVSLWYKVQSLVGCCNVHWVVEKSSNQASKQTASISKWIYSTYRLQVLRKTPMGKLQDWIFKKSLESAKTRNLHISERCSRGTFKNKESTYLVVEESIYYIVSEVLAATQSYKRIIWFG